MKTLPPATPQQLFPLPVLTKIVYLIPEKGLGVGVREERETVSPLSLQSYGERGKSEQLIPLAFAPNVWSSVRNILFQLRPVTASLHSTQGSQPKYCPLFRGPRLFRLLGRKKTLLCFSCMRYYIPAHPSQISTFAPGANTPPLFSLTVPDRNIIWEHDVFWFSGWLHEHWDLRKLPSNRNLRFLLGLALGTFRWVHTQWIFSKRGNSK